MKEEARIRATLVEIQGMNLPNMDTMKKHIAQEKTLINEKKFSIGDPMMELLEEVYIALHASKVL